VTYTLPSDIDECAVYGYSGRDNNKTLSCLDGVNSRTITCQLGYYAQSPDKPSIVLGGSENFYGCFGK
jgi:hypothetical protein